MQKSTLFQKYVFALSLFFLSWLLQIQACSDLSGEDKDVYSEHNLPLIKMEVNGHLLTAELAVGEMIKHGLMGRESLPRDHGMLFVFDPPRFTAMWMKNTIIPLSVAFLDKDGIIMNIRDMKPMTEDLHFSEGVAFFALEMNQGWFQERGIQAGDRIYMNLPGEP